MKKKKLTVIDSPGRVTGNNIFFLKMALHMIRLIDMMAMCIFIFITGVGNHKGQVHKTHGPVSDVNRPLPRVLNQTLPVQCSQYKPGMLTNSFDIALVLSCSYVLMTELC